MVHIEHKVGIKANLKDVYRLIATTEGLAKWWTSRTDGGETISSLLNFRFNETCLRFKIAEQETGTKIVWHYHDGGPPEWEGTSIQFLLTETTEQVFVRFSHSNWEKSSDFMAHCNTKWAVFLLSLKDVAEKGKGLPFPDDVQIDHS